MTDSQKITLTFINIRESIAILLVKLITADLILAVIILSIYGLLFLIEGSWFSSISTNLIFLILFSLNGFIKIFLSIYIILDWLNEYYEITPEYIYHKKGIIFRKVEQYRVDHIRRMDIQDSFFGEVLNFATISLYDIRLNKSLDLYLIHDPNRYANILKQLNPNIESEKDHVRLPFIPNEENIEENS